jgi:hypothetical protein
MAKFSKKMMGKEVGDAKIYAMPHTPTGEPLRKQKMTDPNTLTAEQSSPRTGARRVSMGNPAADDVKTSGIKQRGSGAATKGFTSRGPMA